MLLDFSIQTQTVGNPGYAAQSHGAGDLNRVQLFRSRLTASVLCVSDNAARPQSIPSRVRHDGLSCALKPSDFRICIGGIDLFSPSIKVGRDNLFPTGPGGFPLLKPARTRPRRSGDLGDFQQRKRRL